MALWFRKCEENQEPVSVESLLMVKQIVAVLSNDFEQSVF